MAYSLQLQNACLTQLYVLEWHEDEQGYARWGKQDEILLPKHDPVLLDFLKNTTLLKIEGSLHYVCSNDAFIEEHIKGMFDEPQIATQHLAEILSSAEVPLPESGSGYVFIALYDEVYVSDVCTKGIQVFSCSAKESLLQMHLAGKAAGMVQGYNLNKLTFNILITNAGTDDEFLIYSAGALPRRGIGSYLVQELLKAEPVPTEYVHTKQVIKLCHDFSRDVLTEHMEEPLKRIDFLKHSASFFEEEQAFDLELFKQEALGEPSLVDAFETYKNQYEQKQQVAIPDRFEISAKALQQSKKYIRSVIKLDKNFHIYVHAKPEYVEKGFDEERKLKYYKLYFEQES